MINLDNIHKGVDSASKSILKLINTDTLKVGTLYNSWIDKNSLDDNPYNLAVFCQALWQLSGGYGNSKIVTLKVLEKRPSWSKFFIYNSSGKGHIISVHPITEEAINYYRKR